MASLTLVQHWISAAEVDDLEQQLAAGCERGGQVERAGYYRCVSRANGRLNGQGGQWLERLAGASCQT
jgi:hypothetical protein